MMLGPIFSPLAGIYGAAVLLRRAAYDHGWFATKPAPLFLVSVGGLEVGGSGKTPVTGRLLLAYHRAGRPVGLLTRGYGRLSRGLVIRDRGATYDASTIGDEPAMLLDTGLDVPVAACGDRNAGAHALCGLGCEVGVLDDAFVHRAQKRHVDIVVLRGDSPVGNGHLLPWGTLREPISSLGRADVIWLHFRGREAGAVPEWLEEQFPRATFVTSKSVIGPVTHAGEVVNVAHQRVMAVAGIARPDDLRVSLESLGAQVVDFEGFADHHRYTSCDISRMIAKARSHNADGVITTAKDAVKILPKWDGPPLWVLNVSVSIVDGAQELAQLLGINSEFLVEP